MFSLRYLSCNKHNPFPKTPTTEIPIEAVILRYKLSVLYVIPPRQGKDLIPSLFA